MAICECGLQNEKTNIGAAMVNILAIKICGGWGGEALAFSVTVGISSVDCTLNGASIVNSLGYQGLEEKQAD